MEELQVRMVELAPMWVVAHLGFGVEPEDLALNKMKAWAEANQVDLSQRRIFGFNNPSPAAGSPHYGYEVWVEASDGAQPGEGAELKHFGGGRYGVTRVEGVENIFPTWQRLSAWLENSPYRMGHHQWLEEHLPTGETGPGEFALDLYIPLVA
jgi:DNA gyrase inhibitor GyrI